METSSNGNKVSALVAYCIYVNNNPYYELAFGAHGTDFAEALLRALRKHAKQSPEYAVREIKFDGLKADTMQILQALVNEPQLQALLDYENLNNF